jgi:hypothetical protein
MRQYVFDENLMKDLFHGYYRPSNEQFTELWKSCLFSFDASFLLNLYHYSEQTRTAFLNIVTSLGNRIWLTHQAALEYQRGRPKAICQELGPYDKMKAELTDISTTLQSTSKHPFVKPETVAKFNRLSKTLVNELDLGRKAQEEFVTTASDPILLKLTQLFDGRTGQPYPPKKRPEIETDGKDRYAKLIPPGFADLKEKERDPALDPYGDLIVWMQLLDKAKTSKQGVIFVTDDLKEDWWHKHDKRMIGPHPMLRQEMTDAAGCPFYMYTGETFVDYAGEYLNQHVEAEVKREVKEAAEQREWTVLLRSQVNDDPRRHFVGRWRILAEGTEREFVIILSASGEAIRVQTGAHALGKWETVGTEARVTWDDKRWKDILRPLGHRIRKLAFSDGKTWDDQPTNQQWAEKIPD